MPMACGETTLNPGSVYSGGTWQLLQRASPLNSTCPRAAAARSKLPGGGGGGSIDSTYVSSAASLGVTRSGVFRIRLKPLAAAMGNCCRVGEASVGEDTLTEHLEIDHERHPGAEPAKAVPRHLTHTLQPEERRDERGGGPAVGTRCFAVEVQESIELAATPASKHAAHDLVRNAERVAEERQVRGHRDDGADVELAARPAVAATTDAGGEAVIDGRVAERTLDAEALDLADASKNPVSPITASSFRSSSVTAGSSRSTLPLRSALRSARGSASTSTLSPRDSAVAGLTPPPTPPFAAPAMAR